MSDHFKSFLSTLIIAIIVFLGGLYLGETGMLKLFTQLETIKPVAEEKGTYEQGYQEALDFARQKLMERGEFMTPGSLAATIKSVSGQNVTIEFETSVLDIFADGMATKTVIVGDDTVIEQHIPRLEEEFEKEYLAFEKAREEYEVRYVANPDDPNLQEPQEPQEYTVKTLTVSDLQAGDRIFVRAEEGAFVNDTFEATYIRLEYRPEPLE